MLQFKKADAIALQVSDGVFCIDSFANKFSTLEGSSFMNRA